MSVQPFRYDFTAKKLAYFLFKKKACPRCGEQMKKDKCCETIGGSACNTNSVPPYIRDCQVKHCFYRFICQGCGARFILIELPK